MSEAPPLERPGSAGTWAALTVALIALYAIIMLLTFRDYGITWDESEHARYGAEVIRWYESGFQDSEALRHRRYRNLGALFDVPPSALARATGLDLYVARHLFGVLFGILGLVFTCRLGSYLGGPRAGFLAGLLLLLTPAYYGHVPSNPKDIPFAALSTAALYYIVIAIPQMPRLTTGLVVRLGFAIGLTLSIRIIGLTLLFYLGAAFVLWLLIQMVSNRTHWLKPGTLLKAGTGFGSRFAAVSVIAFITMLPWWPSLQVNPVSHLRETLRLVFNYPWNLTVLFEGKQIPAADLPWYYIAKSIVLSLPEFYLILLPICLGLLIARFARGKPVPQSAGWAILATSVIFPLVSQAARGAIVYGAWRHFLFIIPVLAVSGGWALSALLERSGARWLRGTVAACAVLSMALTARDMTLLHPYQSLYFNRLLAGGLREASRSYETDYWGLSYREGVEWLTTSYPKAGRSAPIKVTSCSHPVSTSHYLTDDSFQYVGNLDHLREYPDLILATTLWRCHERLQGRVVHVVSRMDTPILYIREVDQDQPIHLEPETEVGP